MKPDMCAYEVSQRWNEIMNDMKKPKTLWQCIKHFLHLDKKERANEKLAKLIIGSQPPQRHWFKLNCGEKQR